MFIYIYIYICIYIHICLYIYIYIYLSPQLPALVAPGAKTMAAIQMEVALLGPSPHSPAPSLPLSALTPPLPSIPSTLDKLGSSINHKHTCITASFQKFNLEK